MAVPMMRAGVIWNPASRLNIGREAPPHMGAGVRLAAPMNFDELDEALADFARSGLDLLVIDGGDGAVREVLSRAPEAFGDQLPRFAILPSGKTNALALDLGAPAGWTLQAALKAASPGGRTILRRPIEVFRPGEGRPRQRGFILGTGAFVRGTRMAQKAHRAGAVGGLAVAMTLAGAVWRTLFGGPNDPWRAGDPMQLGLDGAPVETRHFLLLATTLARLPLGIRLFRPADKGLKALVVEAPPRRLLRALSILLAGRDASWLTPAGYRRAGVDALPVSLGGEFVLDGEIYQGGEITLRLGRPLEFVAP